MKIKFYGVRGSYASPSRQTSESLFAEGRESKVKGFISGKFGGHTTCVGVVDSLCQVHVLDTGDGVIQLNAELMRYKRRLNENLNIFYTHLHHDHTLGMPFFSEANYSDFFKTRIYSMSPQSIIEALEKQDEKASHFLRYVNGSICDEGVAKGVLSSNQGQMKFPVGVSNRFDFVGLTEENKEVLERFQRNQGLQIWYKSFSHAKTPNSDITLSYKIRDIDSGRTFVFLTDFEPAFSDEDEEFIEWIKGTDYVYFDGQYEKGSKENPFVAGFGHSCARYSTEMGLRANVRNILIGHHSPKSDDSYLLGLESRLQEVTGNRAKVRVVREGDVFNL